ncbi:hypothetical protein ES702_07434 [subsurface metagenome]
MADELVPLFQHPSLPDEWDYNKSIKEMKGYLYKFKAIQRKVANELWVAKEVLSSPGRRTDLSQKCEGLETWGSYCEAIGVAKSTVG